MNDSWVILLVIDNCDRKIIELLKCVDLHICKFFFYRISCSSSINMKCFDCVGYLKVDNFYP